MTSIEADIVHWIEHLLQTVGYVGVFVAMLIEGSGVPLPSEITMPFAGFLTVSRGHHFGIAAVIVVGAVGEVCGAGIGYGIGLFGGRALLDRYGRWIMISPHDVERAAVWFERYGSPVVLIARLLPAVRSYISIAAGAAKMPLRPFLALSLLGSVVWCTLLALLGRELGDHWSRISSATRPFEIPIVVGVVILVAVYLVLRHVLGSRRMAAEPAPDEGTS